jgi:UDP-N-acetyl-D-mannosaminuronic acid dehydrogenase
MPRQRSGVGADICVVGGAGHVGLPLSIVFASKGFRALIYDVNSKALEQVSHGEMPFMEKGAEPLLRQALDGRLLFCTTDAADLQGVPVIIITIGTPVDEFLSPSLKAIRRCVDQLVPYLSDDQLIILRSTVYPGVTQSIASYLASMGCNAKVAFCPERIVQGFAIQELQNLPQIVSGVTPEAEDAAAKVFERISPEAVRLSPVEAELTKLFSNAYRYIQFAVANQFYMISNAAGVDYYRILEGMKRNYPRADVPRAGLAAGPCLFKDTMQLAAFYRNQFSLGYAAMLVNEGMPQFIVDKLESEHKLIDVTVGLLGMSFKANIDDPRSSLSYKLKKLLALKDVRVLTTDPYVKGDPEILPLESVIEQSDILILCAPHAVYRDLELSEKIVVDIWDFLEKRAVAVGFQSAAMSASS